jgi:hypothetical protein
MLVALVALILAAGGAAYATIPDSSGTINGCYNTKTGALSVIDTGAGKMCTPSQKAISFAATDANARVADSEKLGGLGSTAFLRSNAVRTGGCRLVSAPSADSTPADETLLGDQSFVFGDSGTQGSKYAFAIQAVHQFNAANTVIRLRCYADDASKPLTVSGATEVGIQDGTGSVSNASAPFLGTVDGEPPDGTLVLEMGVGPGNYAFNATGLLATGS